MTERQARYLELTELVMRAAEGDLDAAGHARLESLLTEDAEARSDYADLMLTISSLDWRAGAETHAARAADSAIGQVLLTGVIDRQREELSRRMLEEEEQRRLQQLAAERRRQRDAAAATQALADPRVIVIPKAAVWLGLAAAIALIASVVWLSQPETPQTQTPPVAAEDRPRERSGAGPVELHQPVRVARVTSVLDAQWADGRGVEPGAPIYDRPIELASGIIALTMSNGVTLTIEAPARVVPASDMLITLDRGKLVSHVPDQARGFTVRTDTMSVIGLGAEIAVESGGTRGSAVHVLGGSARLEPGRTSAGFDPVLTQAGDAAVVLSGTAPRPTASQPSAFYRLVPGAYEHAVREAQPFAYWRFNAVDHNGELVGLGTNNAKLTGLWTSDVSDDAFPGGERGDKSLWLSGRRSIRSDAMDGIDVRAGFSVEAWVFVPSDIDRRMRVIANNALHPTGRHAGGFGLGVSGADIDTAGAGPVLLFTGFSVFDATSRTPVPTDRWVHVAASLDEAGQLSMYINGRLVAHRISDQAGIDHHPEYHGRLFVPPSDAAVQVGDALVPVGSPSEHWVGGIDELAVYDWVLDAEEIASHAGS